MCFFAGTSRACLDEVQPSGSGSLFFLIPFRMLLVPVGAISRESVMKKANLRAAFHGWTFSIAVAAFCLSTLDWPRVSIGILAFTAGAVSTLVWLWLKE